MKFNRTTTWLTILTSILSICSAFKLIPYEEHEERRPYSIHPRTIGIFSNPHSTRDEHKQRPSILGHIGSVVHGGSINIEIRPLAPISGIIGHATRIISKPLKPGHEKPQGGYEKPPPEYEKPHSGYERPHPGYEKPHPGYEKPHPGYERPHPGYERPHPGYEKPHPGYERPQPGYEKPHPGYERPQPGYEKPHSGYEKPHPGYERPQPGYEKPQPGYEKPHPGYQRPRPGYEKPPPPPPQPPKKDHLEEDEWVMEDPKKPPPKPEAPKWEDIGEDPEDGFDGEHIIQPRRRPKRRTESKVYKLGLVFRSNGKPYMVKFGKQMNDLIASREDKV